MSFPVTSQSTVAQLAEVWLQRLRAEGRLEKSTINEYERVLLKLVAPNSVVSASANSQRTGSTFSSRSWARRVRIASGRPRS